MKQFYYEKSIHGLVKRTLDDIKFNIALDDNLMGDSVLDSIQNSDITDGVYEGGLSTWESSLDLVYFLNDNLHLFNDKTVIELGCGPGLPGIFTHKNGARSVCFQDYNSIVLDIVVTSNLILNSLSNLEFDDSSQGSVETDLSLPSNISFHSGDWKLLSTVMSDEKFQVILTSETIYNSDSIPSLLNLIKVILAPNGIVLLAAKHIYFGCSGSLPLFKALAEDEGFDIETVFVINAGVRREIICLRNR